jgi:hypothetical protein
MGAMKSFSRKRQSLFDVDDKLTSDCVGFLHPALPNGHGRGSALTLRGLTSIVPEFLGNQEHPATLGEGGEKKPWKWNLRMAATTVF